MFKAIAGFLDVVGVVWVWATGGSALGLLRVQARVWVRQGFCGWALAGGSTLAGPVFAPVGSRGLGDLGSLGFGFFLLFLSSAFFCSSSCLCALFHDLLFDGLLFGRLGFRLLFLRMSLFLAGLARSSQLLLLLGLGCLELGQLGAHLDDFFTFTFGLEREESKHAHDDHGRRSPRKGLSC